MTATTFVPTLSVYNSPVTKQAYNKLTIQFVGSVFVKTADWLKRLGCKFKRFVNKSAGTVEFTFFHISDAVLAKIAAHNAKRAAEIDEAKANGFDGTVAPPPEKVAAAIAISKRLQAAAPKGHNGFSSADAPPAQSYTAPAELPVAEPITPQFVAATAQQLADTFTVPQLKAMCRANYLKLSGNKMQLCERLEGCIGIAECFAAADARKSRRRAK